MDAARRRHSRLPDLASYCDNHVVSLMALSLALLSGGRGHILSLLADDPTWKRTRLKSADSAASMLAQLAKRVVQDEARAMFLPEIQIWYSEYVKTNGDRSDINDALGTTNDWDEGHDDGILALFEPYAEVLSGSWMHQYSTDAQLWKPGEDERLAIKFAEEVWKQLTWDHVTRLPKTDRQILAGVGIVADDLAKYGELSPEVTTPPEPEFKTTMMNAVLNKIMLYNPPDLADELDMASSDDDGLAVGACQRLGITVQEGLTLRQARLRGATIEDWVTVIEKGEFLDETVTENASATNDEPPFDAGPDLPKALVRNPPPPPPPPPLGAPKPKGSVPPPPPPQGTPTVTAGPAPATNSGRGGRRPKNSEQAPAGAIQIEVLRSIKEHAGIKDEDFANILGISRPTLANIMKGKGWCVPSDERRRALYDMLTKHSAKLTDAAREIIPF